MLITSGNHVCQHRAGGDKVLKHKVLRQINKYIVIKSAKIWWDKTQPKNTKGKTFYSKTCLVEEERRALCVTKVHM